MSLLLNWRVWAAVMLALVLAASHWKAYKVGQAGIRADWQAEKLDTAKQTLRLLESNAATNAALQAGADTLRRTKNAQITRLSADLAAALAGLQNRPDRPSAGSVPTDTGTGANTGCTGAQLYRPDAEFLVRESARAQRLLTDLAQCQAAYDQARKAVNK
jgi:hypothetical protein